MDRKVLITSVFITLGAIAFLSGYLLMPETNLSRQTGTFIERFNNNVEVGSSDLGESPARSPRGTRAEPGLGSGVSVGKVSDTLTISSRKFISFVNLGYKRIIAIGKNGDVVEIDTDNLREKVVATLNQGNISEVLLSPAGDSIVYSFYNAKNNKKHVYLNFKNSESTDIVGNLKSAAFSPRGDQLAYLISNEGGGELLISKGANVIKRALKTRLDAALVNWPSDFVSVVSYDKDGYGNLFILKDDGTFNKAISSQHDLSVKWSPSGEKIIFSAKDDNDSGRLFYKDAKNNGTAVDLDANVNASKCAWADEESVICGVKNPSQIKYEFYKINVADGAKALVSTPSINLLVREMTVSRSGDYIFALNDLDSKLYALKIK